MAAKVERQVEQWAWAERVDRVVGAKGGARAEVLGQTAGSGGRKLGLVALERLAAKRWVVLVPVVGR